MGQTSEKMLKAASPEIQMMVMQKGFCLGPVPSKEVFNRIDQAEEKLQKEKEEEEARLREEEAARQAQQADQEDEAMMQVDAEGFDAPPTIVPGSQTPVPTQYMPMDAPPTMLPDGQQTPMPVAAMAGQQTPGNPWHGPWDKQELADGQQTPMANLQMMSGQQTPANPWDPQQLAGQQTPMAQAMLGGATPLMPQQQLQQEQQWVADGRLEAMWTAQTQQQAW